MSVRYKTTTVARAEHTQVASQIRCDACGADALYPAHRRATAVLSRVQDSGGSNWDIWELDLCRACKDAVMALLRDIAAGHGRNLPDTRVTTGDG